MPDKVRDIHVAEVSLNTVGAGLLLARQIVESLERGESVVLDLSAAQRMTPSFANVLVMTVLEAVGETAMSVGVSTVFAADAVAESWAKAVERYRRGVRLSTQRPGAA